MLLAITRYAAKAVLWFTGLTLVLVIAFKWTPRKTLAFDALI
ncbi:hypothetical protein [Erythrobacter tepidarius]|nr:hypothetical protein [Erythrobacter tepidarius]